MKKWADLDVNTESMFQQIEGEGQMRSALSENWTGSSPRLVALFPRDGKSMQPGSHHMDTTSANAVSAQPSENRSSRPSLFALPTRA